MTYQTGRRPGYTLIELLVVVSIAVVLLTLLVAFGPSLAKSNQINRTASQVQGWLSIAKQRAYRDKKPVGIEFVSQTEARYIEQPDDVVFTASTSGTTITRLSPPGLTLNSYVVAGDFVQVANDTPTTAACGRVVLGPPNPPTGNTLSVGSALPTLTGTQCRVHRSARPMVGEMNLLVPSDTVVDLGQSRPSGVSRVLFSPAGGLVGVTEGRINLWIRGEPNAGEQFLITISARTGAIAVHPVALSGDPYQFTLDGRSSGL